MTLTDFIIRITTATLFGLLIGLERQLTGNVAGIRINVLVCLGSCIFVLFSFQVLPPDLTRVASQIVTGVGFLCSGIIVKDGVSVRGLNTAATIWCTAAIGVLTSSGAFLPAAAATLLLLATNLLLKLLAPRIRPLRYFDEREHYYRLTLVCASAHELRIRSLVINAIRDTKNQLSNLESAQIADGKAEIKATLLTSGIRRDRVVERLIGRLSLDEEVTRVGWEMI